MGVPASGQALPVVGDRVSLHVVDATGARDVLGFVDAVDDERVEVLDRHGRGHAVRWSDVAAWRRIPVSRGRNPAATPRWLLDELAARAGAGGEPWVARISDVLAGQRPPAAFPAWGSEVQVGNGVRARFEGEWVTLADGDPDAWRAAAWWATRMGARSIQVRTGDPAVAEALLAAGFARSAS